MSTLRMHFSMEKGNITSEKFWLTIKTNQMTMFNDLKLYSSVEVFKVSRGKGKKKGKWDKSKSSCGAKLK